MLSERWPWEGVFTVTRVRHADDCACVLHVAGNCDCDFEVLEVGILRNLIVDAGRNLARDMLRGATGFYGPILYVALGTDGTAPAAAQTQLVAETFRKPVTKQTPGSTGQLVTTIYLAPAENNVAIAELGWFANGATSAANSGIMIARALYSHTKTALESLQFDRTDQF